MILLLAGACTVPPPAPVSPALLRQQIVDPTPWALDTSASRVRAATPNAWDDRGTTRVFARLGVQCDTVDRRLRVVVVVNNELRVHGRDDDDGADALDDEENEGLLEQLLGGILDAILFPDYVSSQAYWDEDPAQDLKWTVPEQRGGFLVMEAKDDVDDLLAALRKHDMLILVVEFRDFGERSLVFDLREHRTMDDTVGAVLQACRRQRGLA